MKLFAGIMISVALLTSSGINAAGELQPYEELSQAPDLNLLDLAARQHRLAAYRGQVVLVNFWACSA